MNRSDRLVAVVVAATLLAGGVLTLRATPQSGMMGSGMHSPMAGAHGPAPITYAFGTALLAALVVVGYLLVRDSQTGNGEAERTASAAASDTSSAAAQAATAGATGEEPDADGTTTDPDEAAGVADAGDISPADRVLDLLPEDERRVLGPVVDSPGLTQIELRDRAEFSKSKVSQTVSDLEKRGLLYREPQGRTYRVYPSDDLLSGDAPES